MSIRALILAGGKGSRLGAVRKADLRIGGRRLLDMVAGHLTGAERPLLISTGPGPVVPDMPGLSLADLDLQLAGPMAGLVAAVQYLRVEAMAETILVSVAVDTPFLPDDFLERIVAPVERGALAAYAAWGDDFYPTNAAWRLSALAGLPELAAAGTAPDRPKQLLRLLDAEAVDWWSIAHENPFSNLNTVADLVTLGRRARSPGQ